MAVVAHLPAGTRKPTLARELSSSVFAPSFRGEERPSAVCRMIISPISRSDDLDGGMRAALPTGALPFLLLLLLSGLLAGGGGASGLPLVGTSMPARRKADCSSCCCTSELANCCSCPAAGAIAAPATCRCFATDGAFGSAVET